MILLIVENEIEIKNQIAALAEQIGFEVKTAADGQKALEIYQSQQIDGLFANICLPNIDGVTLAKKLKKSARDFPIILCSLYNTQEWVRNFCDFFCPLYPYNENLIIGALLILRQKIRAQKYSLKQERLSLQYA